MTAYKSIIAPSLLSCDLANIATDAQRMLDMYVHRNVIKYDELIWRRH